MYTGNDPGREPIVMTDDPADRRDTRSEGGPSEEWIARIAESEGVSEEEVVEQLVSSYWTLKEMHGLMEQSEEGIDTEELPLDVERVFADSVSGDIDEIGARLDRLEEAIAGATVDDDTGEIAAQLEMLSQRINGVEEKLTERQDSLEDRFDEEFANLETILDYLIDTTDELDDRIDSIAGEQESDREHRNEQERLVELKRLASRLGVRSAKCEYCDSTIEIALLPTPDCPQCDRRFTDIQPSTRWFGFGTDVLKVTEEPYLDDRTERETPTAEAESTSDGSDPFEWGDARE